MLLLLILDTGYVSSNPDRLSTNTSGNYLNVSAENANNNCEMSLKYLLSQFLQKLNRQINQVSLTQNSLDLHKAQKPQVMN